MSTPSEETVDDRPARTPLASRLRDVSIRTKIMGLVIGALVACLVIISGDMLTVHYLRTGKAANLGAEVVTELSETTVQVTQTADRIQDDADARSTLMMTVMIATIAVVMAVLLALGVFVTRQIRRPVAAMRDALERLARAT